MYKIIADKEELKWFYDNVVADLTETEAHFMSLSARNKYLTDEEKVELALGRTEMFARNTIRYNTWEKFLSTVRKFETNEGSYLTKNGKNIPSKALVCYFNINPSDHLKAYNRFIKQMNEYMFELGQVAINKSDPAEVLWKIGKQKTLLMNCYQKATGTRHWIDFDFDIDKAFLPYIEKIVEQVKFFKGRAYIIDTKSGFHLLISKSTQFNKDFNPKTIVDDATLDAEFYFRDAFPKLSNTMLVAFLSRIEIIHNKNVMIPLPGTFAGNYPIKVINKYIPLDAEKELLKCKDINLAEEIDKNLFNRMNKSMNNISDNLEGIIEHIK